MKTKLTNMLKGKEKIKETKLNAGRWRKFIDIKDDLQAEKNSRKGKQRNKCRKNKINFKKLKW